MSLDEGETHARLMRLSAAHIDPLIVSHRGRVVKHTGDGFIATFASPLDGVTCAVALQNALVAAERSLPRDRRLMFRIGLDVGEVIVDRADVFGNHVNIAARLQTFADAGGVVLSDALLGLVRGRIDLQTRAMGDLELRHIAGHTRAHAIAAPAKPGSRDDGPVPVDSERPAVRPAIAVLPFREPQGPTDGTYLGDGVADDITSSLAGLQDLVVVSATSTRAYRESKLDLAQVSRDLGVSYVVTGSVRRRSDQLRILVELNESATGRILWAKQFDGRLTDLFGFQDQISVEVIATVLPHIRGAELRRAMTKKPDSMDAYEFFLRGTDLLRGHNESEFVRSKYFLHQAIEADAAYVPSYAYAALWHVRNVAQGWSSDTEGDTREAGRLSGKAIELDSGYSLGLAIHGHCRSYLNKDHAGARLLLDEAVRASPNNSMALMFSSFNHAYMGRAADAIDHAQRALRLAPRDLFAFFLHGSLCLAHVAAKSFEEAVIWGYRSFAENSRSAANLRLLVVSLTEVGRLDEAKRIAALLLTVDPKFRVSEFESRLPFRDPSLRASFLANLRLAGLPG
jgi:TolB-like protein